MSSTFAFSSAQSQNAVPCTYKKTRALTRQLEYGCLHVGYRFRDSVQTVQCICTTPVYSDEIGYGKLYETASYESLHAHKFPNSGMKILKGQQKKSKKKWQHFIQGKKWILLSAKKLKQKPILRGAQFITLISPNNPLTMARHWLTFPIVELRSHQVGPVGMSRFSNRVGSGFLPIGDGLICIPGSVSKRSLIWPLA